MNAMNLHRTGLLPWISVSSLTPAGIIFLQNIILGKFLYYIAKANKHLEFH